MARLDGTTIYGNLMATGTISGRQVFGAVYNDYAELRKVTKDINLFVAGTVVQEVGDGTVKECDTYASPLAYIISDTYGVLMGERESAIPVGLAGRVLAYFDENYGEPEFGMPVCASPNGKIMPLPIDLPYPNSVLSILGVISEIPDYLIWGTEDVVVNGRVWVNLK